jgi:hypothetical protein
MTSCISWRLRRSTSGGGYAPHHIIADVIVIPGSKSYSNLPCLHSRVIVGGEWSVRTCTYLFLAVSGMLCLHLAPPRARSACRPLLMNNFSRSSVVVCSCRCRPVACGSLVPVPVTLWLVVIDAQRSFPVRAISPSSVFAV